MVNRTKVIDPNSQINGNWGPGNMCNRADVTQLDKCQDRTYVC